MLENEKEMCTSNFLSASRLLHLRLSQLQTCRSRSRFLLISYICVCVNMLCVSFRKMVKNQMRERVPVEPKCPEDDTERKTIK